MTAIGTGELAECSLCKGSGIDLDAPAAKLVNFDTAPGLLASVVYAFGPQIRAGDDIDGADLVQWLVNTFIPDCCRVLGIPCPEEGDH